MKIYSTFTKAIAVSVVSAAVVLSFSSSAFADRYRSYEVTITNITKGQSFTPQLVAAHDKSVTLFELGQSADLSIELLAEAGDTSMLTSDLQAAGGHVSEVVTVPGLLAPGASVSTTIKVHRYHRYLSLGAMLLPTNDTFVALNKVSLPYRGKKTYVAVAYDAGTEANDQNCLNIPGPRCGGAAHSAGPNVGDEGYVHVSNGFHDLGTEDADGNEILSPFTYDWRNPVAIIEVRALKGW